MVPSFEGMTHKAVHKADIGDNVGGSRRTPQLCDAIVEDGRQRSLSGLDWGLKNTLQLRIRGFIL
jgi:hypothetical protein